MSTGLIFKQIPLIMREVEAIEKLRDNKAQGFKFRGIDDIYNELHPRLAKHGVFTVPEVLDERREERPTKSGGISTHVILKIKFTFFAEDGSSITATMIGEGADSGDKASNKAQAIAHKYALLQVFAIPTENEKDPDAESVVFQERQARPPAQKKNPRPAAVESDPGAFQLPKSWKKNGGMKLRDLGADGVSQVVDWLKKLENEKGGLHDSLQQVLDNCDAYLRQGTKTKSGGENWPEDAPDSAYDMAGAR